MGRVDGTCTKSYTTFFKKKEKTVHKSNDPDPTDIFTHCIKMDHNLVTQQLAYKVEMQRRQHVIKKRHDHIKRRQDEMQKEMNEMQNDQNEMQKFHNETMIKMIATATVSVAATVTTEELLTPEAYMEELQARKLVLNPITAPLELPAVLATSIPIAAITTATEILENATTITSQDLLPVSDAVSGIEYDGFSEEEEIMSPYEELQEYEEEMMTPAEEEFLAYKEHVRETRELFNRETCKLETCIPTAVNYDEDARDSYGEELKRKRCALDKCIPTTICAVDYYSYEETMTPEEEACEYEEHMRETRELLNRETCKLETCIPTAINDEREHMSLQELRADDEQRKRRRCELDTCIPTTVDIDEDEEDLRADDEQRKKRCVLDNCDRIDIFAYYKGGMSRAAIATKYSSPHQYIDKVLAITAAKTREGKFYEELELMNQYEAGATKIELKEFIWSYQGKTSKTRTEKRMGVQAIDTILSKEYIKKLKSTAIKRCMSQFLKENPGYK